MSHPQNDSGTAGEPSAPTRGSGAWPRLFLDGAVALALCGVLAAVYAFDRGSSEEPPPPPPPGKQPIDDEPVADPIPPPPNPTPSIDLVPRIEVSDWTPDGRFGVMTTTGDPDDPDDDGKWLTFPNTVGNTSKKPNGWSNNTRVWVDEKDQRPIFGSAEGKTVVPIGRRPNGQIVCAWEFRGVRFEQVVETEANEALRPKQKQFLTDTLRVSYTMTNTDGGPHWVALRVMLDTFIGAEDGVPFFVPTREQLITRPDSFAGAEVPPYLFALEKFFNADRPLDKPGVVVKIGGLRPESGDGPTQVYLTRWPTQSADYDYTEAQKTVGFRGVPNTPDDSALTLYFARKKLGPGEKRTVSFTYGLGSFARGNDLTLQAPGKLTAGGKFFLTAIVQPAEEGQKIALELPRGLTLDQGVTAVQEVSKGERCGQVNWAVQADRNAVGDFKVVARLTQPRQEPKEAEAMLKVQPRDSRLSLVPTAPKEGERGFWVTAYVGDPKPGQSVELTLSGPPGVGLPAGKPAKKDVVAAPGSHSGYAQWLVAVDPGADGEVVLAATLRDGDGNKVQQEESKIAVKRGQLNLFGN